MLSSPFPYFSAGVTELTATILQHMLEQMRRQARLLPAAPILIDHTGEGWQIRVAGQTGVWAIAGAQETAGRYAWDEAQLTPAGWAVKPGGRTGGGSLAATETGHREDVRSGEVIWVRTGGDGLPVFTAPVPADAAPAATWARLDATDGTTYGWTELTYDAETEAFAPLPGGRVVPVSAPEAAVEVNGQTAPQGAIVVLFRAPQAATTTWAFEYGGSDPGFWIVLRRESKGAVYTADLGGATGGTWTLSFDAGPAPAPGTASGVATLRVGMTDAEVADAIAPFAAGNVAVAGAVFTFTGDLSGESGATLSGDGGGLTGTQGAFSLTRTTVPRDLPATDGAGGYAWFAAEFDAFGYLRPAPASGSVWPVGLAIEANGQWLVPEGAVVWARPRAAGTRLRAAAEALPVFADWSQAERDQHFADVDTDGTLTDAGVDFVWWGDNSFWAELAPAADPDGRYPFRVVHMGGRDAVSAPPAAPDPVTADDLRAARLAGDYGAVDVAPAPVPAADRAWVGSRPGGREITGVATELVGRTGFPAGTVVRVHAYQTARGVVFTFTGPPVTIWATIGAAAGSGRYAWTELEPPRDPLTGVPRAPRTGTATEESGATDVAPGTVAFLYPESPAAAGYRFRRLLDGPEGGRDCRLITTDGAGGGSVVGDVSDPAADGTAVTVAYLPARDGAALMPPGRHVGYRLPGATGYVVPVPVEWASDRTPGYVTTSGQVLGGQFAFGSGVVVAGDSVVPPLPPPQRWRVNIPALTAEVYTPEITALTADGALTMTGGGPRIVAGGGVCDLQNAQWCVAPTQSWYTGSGNTVVLAPTRDGPTGTFAVPGRGGATPGSITFQSGLFVGYTAPGAAPPMFTGTFLMREQAVGGGTRTVTVVDGVVTNVTL